jgi:zinc transport system substrate-binding protein
MRVPLLRVRVYPALRCVAALLLAAAAAVGGARPVGAPGPAPAGPATGATGAAPRFVTTCPALAFILREVARGRADVVSLTPAGASPHTFEPRPSDLAEAERALGLFFVSPLLDGWAARLPARARVEVLRLVPGALALRSLESGADGHPAAAAGDAPAGAAADPHFWTDPLIVREIVPALAGAMTRLDPAGAATYERNASAFAARLTALDARIAARLAPVRGRPVLLFHPSFQYLIRRYGLRLAGVLEPFPGKEPTPRALQAAVALVAREGVKAVFSEPQLPRRPAEVLAEAAGIKVFVLDPLGGAPGRESYEELLDYNAGVLLEALR